MRMNLTTQLVLKISNILPKLSYFVPGKAHPDVVKLCVEELKNQVSISLCMIMKTMDING